MNSTLFYNNSPDKLKKGILSSLEKKGDQL